MTTNQELNLFLRRHNRAAWGKAATAAGMSILAWVAVPALVSGVFYIYTFILSGEAKLPPVLLWTLVYPGVNALVFLWRILRGEELNYDSHGNILHLVFWPAYLTAEAVAQIRRTERFSRADRAEALAFLLRAHQAGMDGFSHGPTEAERGIIRRLEALGALHVVAPHGGAMRITRCDPRAPGALPGTIAAADLPPVGLIAGGGTQPLDEARDLHLAGRRVAAIGLSGRYDPALVPLCDSFTEISPRRPGAWARHLRRRGAFEAVMAGTLAAAPAGGDLSRPDLPAGLADTLRHKGILLADSMRHLRGSLPI